MHDDLQAAVGLALTVGRADNDADSSVPPPPALRPFFSFAKLPPAARKAAVTVIDADADFRARVADRASEHAVGRVGWLWLHRPDGWQEEIDSIRDAEQAEERRRVEARDERKATRRLAMAEERAVAAEQALASLEADIADERVAFASVRDERDEAQRRLAESAAEVEQGSGERRRILAQFKAEESRAASLLEERRVLQQRVAELEAERVADADRAEFTAAVTSGTGERPGPVAVEAVVVEPGPTVDQALVERARRDLEALVESLTTATATAEALAHELSDRPGRNGATAAGNGSATSVRSTGPRTEPRTSRRPTALPVGIFDDSVEAADHLFRVPEMLALVDGYNVSMSAWPDLSIADQRRRLVDGLDALTARTRLRVDLVFDGQREPDAVPTRRGPRNVRVLYTETGVEADDVILDRIGEYPTSQPILVVSSDRRVADGARQRGANVLDSALLARVITTS